jgi:hypothetical protein
MILVFLEIERSWDAIRPQISKVHIRAFFSKPILFPAYLMIIGYL